MVASLAATCAGFSTRQQAVVSTLMECEECTDGELDSVIALGKSAVPILGRYARTGPPPDRVDRVRRFVAAEREALAHRSGGVGPDSLSYVEGHVSNYVARYRTRAALALARIGGLKARVALDSAALVSARPDVAAALRFAIDSLWHP